MSRFGRFASVVVAAMLVFGAVGVTADAAPIVFSPTPVSGWSTNGPVRSVLIVGDTVYAGGLFTQVHGPGGSPTAARSNLAAFDVHTGALRTGFTADTNGRVDSLATDGTHLFIGGDFTTVKGVGRSRLASLDLASGNVNTAFTTGATSWVYSLRVKGSRLYVGGAFGTLGGVSRSKVGAVSTTTGAVDPGFNPNVNDAVHGIVVSPDGNTVYLGGDFTTVGGVANSYMASVSASTGALLPLTFQYPHYVDSSGGIWKLDISPSGDRVFAALGGYENQAIAWSTTTGARLWYRQVNGDAESIRYYNGNVYFGFHEGDINDGTVRMLVVDAATGADVSTYRLPINSFFGVWDIDASANGLVIGGEFTNVNGVATQGVAILPPGSTDPVPPTPPANVRVTGTSATTISLAWDPGTDNVGVAGYRVLRNGVDVGYPTGTTYTDANLAAATDYSYSVQTIDLAGNLSTATTTVPAGTDLSLVTAGSSWKYLDNGANQGTAWRAPAFNDSTWAAGPAQLGYGDGDEATVVGYGPDANHKYTTTYFRRQFTVPDPSTLANVTLSLLRDDGAVVYLNGVEVLRSNMPSGTITSTTNAPNDVTGAEESQWFPFTINPALFVAGTNTLAVEIHQNWGGSSDISFDLSLSTGRHHGPAAPANLRTTAVTGTSASLAWDAPAGTITGYHVFRDGVLVGSPSGTTFTDPTLTSAQTYGYTVTAVDDANAESAPTAPLAVTTPDVVAPARPTGVTASIVSGTRVTLTWSPATDNVGVTGYDVLRGGAVIGTATTPTFTDLGVGPNQTYSYTVRARDAAGNVSAESAPLPVTTPDSTDLTPPSTPQNLRATGRSASQIVLAWDASTDDTGVAKYVVTRNGVDLPATAGTTITDTLLAPGTTYTYTVRAVDAALNVSGLAGPLGVTTHRSTETVVAAKSVWKYTDDGVDRGTAWRATAYDDSAWKSGAGILGYNQGDEGTLLYNGGSVQSQRYVSHYFRKTVTVGDASSITGYTLSALRTDGIVVYVNGVEAFRDNMPTGTIAYDSYAINVISGAERAQEIYHPFTIPASMFHEGTNVIAVSVHHGWRGGADALSFDATLTASYS